MFISESTVWRNIGHQRNLENIVIKQIKKLPQVDKIRLHEWHLTFPLNFDKDTGLPFASFTVKS